MLRIRVAFSKGHEAPRRVPLTSRVPGGLTDTIPTTDIAIILIALDIGDKTARVAPWDRFHSRASGTSRDGLVCTSVHHVPKLFCYLCIYPVSRTARLSNRTLDQSGDSSGYWESIRVFFYLPHRSASAATGMTDPACSDDQSVMHLRGFGDSTALRSGEILVHVQSLTRLQP